MLSNPLLPLALLWVSNWLACNYEPYKTLQKMQNMFTCLQRISHKLEASLEFMKYPSEPVISILLGKAHEHCTAKDCCWRTGQYCSPAPEMELVIAV